MAETNQLLLNYYKKEETKKIKKLSEEKASLKTILGIVNFDYITKDEVLETLGEDYEQEIENIKDIKEDDFNTSSVIENTPMGKAQEYKKYYEQNNRNRSLTCKEKNIGNGTLQRYLRLNYLIPELQELVNNKKISINIAEYISYLDKSNQMVLFKVIEECKYKISESMAKRIKEDYKKDRDYKLTKEKIENYKNEKIMKIRFTQEEIEEYFNGIPRRKLKEYVISILEKAQDV